jgi:predicted AlkP superfamily phosphohydrolase/phosphomutase
MLILGLDGLNWDLLAPILAAGAMPHLARLQREGAWGPLASVVPTQSATAWASFITGQNPARHGVLDFVVRRADGTYRHAKPNPATTLWHHLGRGGLRVGVLNFPVTYPPDAVNGFLVSGMLSPTGKTFTHPPALGPELLGRVPGYRLDLEWQIYNNREGALLQDLVEMTRQRARAARYLRDRYEPDCLAVAFVGPDRLQHALWRHLDPGHPRHDAGQAEALTGAIYGFYATLDEAVGQLVTEAGPETTVILLSDHGFQAAAWQFRVDDWLASQGWLAWQAGRSRLTRLVRRFDTPWVRHLRRRLVKDISQHFAAFAPGGTVDWSRTVAFGPWNAQQGVRINVRGREPQGIVAPGADYESLRDEIRCALLEATAPQTGRPVVAQVWNREEIYDGPFLDEMPDLVLALRSPFAASPLQPGLWSPTGWGSGDHSLTGMTILRGPAVAPGRVEGSELIDVVPTILYLLGQPLPAALDGRVLTRALDRAFVAAHPIRHLEPGDHGPAAGLAGEVLTPEEEAEVQARLRGLGYL